MISSRSFRLPLQNPAGIVAVLALCAGSPTYADQRVTLAGNEVSIYNLAGSLTVEPGYLYFHPGHDAAPDFGAPQDTFELRGHFSLRGDALKRNLLELPHLGFAFGGDATIGRRFNWDDWGIENQESASATP